MPDEHQKSHAETELDVLKYWDEYQCFKKSVDSRPKGKPYVFYDGPPFATGLPHYGHLVGSVMKDVVPRFWTMKGFRVDRTWGWDCHGLPIENIVEKKFDLGSRKDIEKFGIEQFNNSCHEIVLTYAEEWKKVIYRLGRWVDMERAYKTMDLPFMESVWWVFKSLWDKEMIYEGYKPMHICPRCETVLSNFEVNQGYADVTDISVTVEFRLLTGRYAGVDVLAWTTTPWTLPGNVLLAVGKSLPYVIVSTPNGRFIVAKDLVGKVFGDSEHTIDEAVVIDDLVGSTYEPLFPFFKDHANAFKVVVADFVTIDDGTGVVHIAPGFGEDDRLVGHKENVEPIIHVKMNGHFVPEVADPLSEAGYKVKDVPVKSKEDRSGVDVEILRAIAHDGKLFSKEKITHSYPHCWRCDTPLLNYATSSWFVKVEEIKEKLVLTNKEINWVPDHIKEGRFGKWLEGAHDWAISRSRFWGTPLPIWRSEDGEIICVGSKQELEDLSGEKIDNLHKHVMDKIVIHRGGKEFHRIPEVLDCWFESGSMPYAQVHYPFENQEEFDAGFPAEFIAEGQDQTRGWFYTLHVLSNALFGMPAFKNVIVNGIVLAEDGKKMSKRLNNYPDPMTMMEKYGADAVRYYLMSSPVVRAENLRFSESGVVEVSKNFINILRNVLSFYQLYGEHDDSRTPSGKHVLDTWILARLNETVTEVTKQMEGYELSLAARPMQLFVTDFSTWYLRRSRDRMKVEGDDRAEAVATLRVVLETFAKILAPIMPMLAEVIYQEINGGFIGREDRLSVHLESWPEATTVDEVVIEKMGELRAIVSRVLDQREAGGRAIKQALGQVTVWVPSGEIAPGYLEVLLDEVNVKTAQVEKGDLKVELDITLTPALIREGLAREVVRKVNQLRKDSGLTIEDRIDLKVWSAQPEAIAMFSEHSMTIKEATLSESIEFVRDDEVKFKIEFRASEQDFWIGF